MSTPPNKRKLTFQQAARAVFRRLPVVGQPEAVGERPRTRSDCEDGPRPCPWFECKYHLAVDEIGQGNADVERTMIANKEFDWSKPTCALDVADEGKHSVRQVSAILGVNFQRVHAIERHAIRKALRGAASYRRGDDND